MADGSVELRLTNAEALVLFEWLARAHETGHLEVDDAEQRVLWNLESHLETRLTEPFMPDYAELVNSAKDAVLGA